MTRGCRLRPGAPTPCACQAARRADLTATRARRSGTTSSSPPKSARSAPRWMRWAISAACAGCAATRPTCCSTTAIDSRKCGRRTGSKNSGIENARPFFTRGVLFDVQGLKGRVLDVGEEIALADLKACLERQGVDEQTIAPGDVVFVRTGHGTRWYTETSTFYDGAPGIGLECARWFSSLEVCVVGADNFAVEVVPLSIQRFFIPATSTSSWRTE